MSRPEVQKNLGVDHHVPTNFSFYSSVVEQAFSLALDDTRDSSAYVGALLERGVRVLIYVGTYDWICNWVGNEEWSRNLEWTGGSEFAKQELREWSVDGRVVGRTRSHGGFTFATVDGAGHMVSVVP